MTPRKRQSLGGGLCVAWRDESWVWGALKGIDVGPGVADMTSASAVRRARLERRIESLNLPKRGLLIGLPDPGIDKKYIYGRLGVLKGRYADLAERARQQRDAETAFACELNKIGTEECLSLMEVLLDAESHDEARGQPA